jgi:hypothetical protein
MRQADSRQDKMARFRILNLVSEGVFGSTCFQVAKRSGQANWYTRSFRASLATRLRRLRELGLIRCELDRISRSAHSRRDGIYRWRITQRGKDRLAWAKSKGWL